MELVGAWRLVTWEIGYPDGRVAHPYGPDAVGLLCYTPDGHMSASIARAVRPSLSNANPRRADTSERAEAFDSFFAYAGRYEVVGTDVHHHVELGLNPAFPGTTQVRRATLDGDTLSLAAEEDGRRHTLTWRRA